MAATPPITVLRSLLGKYFGDDPRLLRALEDQARTVEETAETVSANVADTGALQDATVVTLSANEALNNEYVLANGDGTKLAVTAGHLAINVDDSVARAEQYKVKLVAPAPVTLFLPVEGQLLSTTFPATVYNKTLDKPAMSGLVDAASDAAAATAGVSVGGIYHNAGALRIRLT